MRRSRHTDDSRQYFDWLEVAARDLLAARVLMEQDQCLEIAGFHCQQCMEKALKAYLVRETGALVDGHNLTWLCRQATKRDPRFQPWLERSADMNRLYIETRYPSDDDFLIEGPSLRHIYDTAQGLYTAICDLVYVDSEDEDD